MQISLSMRSLSKGVIYTSPDMANGHILCWSLNLQQKKLGIWNAMLPEISEKSSYRFHKEWRSAGNGWPEKSFTWSSHVLQTEVLWSHIMSHLSGKDNAGTDAEKTKTRMTGWPHGMDWAHTARVITVGKGRDTYRFIYWLVYTWLDCLTL